MNFERLFDILAYQFKKYPQEVALAHKVNSKGKGWKTYSTKALLSVINELSRGLLALGLQKGDHIAMITLNNRVEWNILDLAMMQIGVVNVPMYATLTKEKFEYIFNHASIKYCFVDGSLLLDKVKKLQKNVSSLEAIYTFDKIEGALFWENILPENTPTTVTLKDVDLIKKNIQPTDLATIIYTSGTTAAPKGVMLSHQNIVSNIKSMMPILPLEYTDRAFSILPLCHIFERTATYTYMAFGASIYYAYSKDTFLEDIKEIKPHYLTVVPDLLEKIYAKIQVEATHLDSLSKGVFDWAVGLGHKFDINKKGGRRYRLQLALARRLILNDWRSLFGNKIKGIIVGSASLQTQVSQLFSAAGIVVREGYGLTETSPVLAFNRFEPGGVRLGTAGIPIPSVTLKINPKDGEILVKGPNVMMGYYKEPERTAAVLGADGWLHTGDIGELVEDRFLRIKGRKKEVFSTQNGQILPLPIETKFREALFIDQIMVVGKNQPYPTALIVPFFDALKIYCKEYRIPYHTHEEMIEHPQVLVRFQEILNTYNLFFESNQQLQQFALLPQAWSLEKEELTPTLKLKRRVILDKYHEVIEKMYSL